MQARLWKTKNDIARVKCGVSPITKKETCGAELSGVVKRSTHGMKYATPGIGDDIELTIQVEAVRD